MLRITREDIQRIGDEHTLLHFLEEKLNLPIPEGATLAQIALPLPLPFLGLDDAVTEQIIDCQDFSGLPQDSLAERRPFLIRFRREQDYPEILRKVAEGLAQRNINPSEIFFICADEDFQPFAFAHFNDSIIEDWHAAILNILTWTQENTHIHTSSEHEVPADFFAPDLPPISFKPISSKELLNKLIKIGTPLSQYGSIHSGVLTGCNGAFVIDEFKGTQLIFEDSSSSELIKPLLMPNQKWKTGLTKKYLIWIPSSEDRRWPWSEARNEVEAKRVFENSYPAISTHLAAYESKLKQRRHQGKFYWEFTPSKLYSMPKQSKIVYSDRGTSLQATYDTSEALPLFPKRFIPTKDLSLLAILNSSLFDWYVQMSKATESNNNSNFKSEFMKNVPIAARTQAQKENLSEFVQQILDDSDSPKVPDLEREIDQLVYELYELTPAEIALIEKGTNP